MVLSILSLCCTVAPCIAPSRTGRPQQDLEFGVGQGTNEGFRMPCSLSRGFAAGLKRRRLPCRLLSLRSTNQRQSIIRHVEQLSFQTVVRSAWFATLSSSTMVMYFGAETRSCGFIVVILFIKALVSSLSKQPSHVSITCIISERNTGNGTQFV